MGYESKVYAAPAELKILFAEKEGETPVERDLDKMEAPGVITLYSYNIDSGVKIRGHQWPSEWEATVIKDLASMNNVAGQAKRWPYRC